MERLNELLKELGISKVKFAEYLGVSRQMIYNYLNMNDINEWPKDKKLLVYRLFDIKEMKDLKNIVVDADYMQAVENRYNETVYNSRENLEQIGDLSGLNKDDQALFTDIVSLIKDGMLDNDSKENLTLYKYLYHFLQAMETSKELKYLLAYVSKTTGFTDPKDFAFDEEEQFIFEGIQYSAMLLFSNGGTSRSKIALTHKRFVEAITQKKEEKLSRTQELNTAKVQALRELGYSEITEDNASEVLAKIAEIQSRKI